MTSRPLALAASAAFCVTVSLAEPYYLLTGVDVRYYPGQDRAVAPVPGPGYPGTFNDGDRLAGTSDRSAAMVPFYGSGTPMFDPNAFGSLSMLYRRGSVPLPFGGGRIPLEGIEFLGGPLLDLDGDLDNGVRALTPVTGATAVAIPGTQSLIDLQIDLQGGTIALLNIDATGTNEGGPEVSAEVSTVLVTIAGTDPSGTPGSAINPAIDTRTGTLTPYTGNSGTLAGVYRIENLGYEFWEDTLDHASSTAHVLGTMQFLGTLRGWLVGRGDAGYPTLAGEGLGTTLWPALDAAHVGQVFNTANGLGGGQATITLGPPQDQFDAPGNGGLPLSDHAGDLGAYLDEVVVPLLGPAAQRFIYLEAAGFGINNSADPIYLDTTSWDVVIIAAAEDACYPQVSGDSNCDGAVNALDINPFVRALTRPDEWEAQYGANCDLLCVNDINRDGVVNALDINPFVRQLTGR